MRMCRREVDSLPTSVNNVLAAAFLNLGYLLRTQQCICKSRSVENAQDFHCRSHMRNKDNDHQVL